MELHNTINAINVRELMRSMPFDSFFLSNGALLHLAKQEYIHSRKAEHHECQITNVYYSRNGVIAFSQGEPKQCSSAVPMYLLESRASRPNAFRQ